MNDEEKYLKLDTTLKILTKEAFDYFIEQLSEKAKRS